MKKTTIFFKLLVGVVLVIMIATTVSEPIVAKAGVTFEDEKSTKKSSKKDKDKSYFSDVNIQYIYKSDIQWLALRGAFTGIAKKGKKFHPDRICTRKEFGIILNNLYGDRINLVIKKPKAKLTQAYMTKTLTKVSEQLGYRVTWSGGKPKAKVSRGKLAYFIVQMVKTAEGNALLP